MFGQIRMIFTVIIIAGIAGGVMYVNKLRSDNAILKTNQIKLEQSIESQTKLLEQQKIDFEAIMESNKKLNVLIQNFKKDLLFNQANEKINNGKKKNSIIKKHATNRSLKNGKKYKNIK